MAHLFYGTSVEQANQILEQGFESCPDAVLLCPDADNAHGDAWLEATEDPNYAVIRTYYDGLAQENPHYRREDHILVPKENLSKLVVRECIIFAMASGEPLEVIVKDD